MKRTLIREEDDPDDKVDGGVEVWEAALLIDKIKSQNTFSIFVYY